MEYKKLFAQKDGISINDFSFQFLEGIKQGVAIVALEDRKIRFINKRFADMFGYEQDELIGMPITILSPQDQWEKDREELEQYLSNPSDNYWLQKAPIRVRKDGTRFPVDIRLNLMRINDKPHIGALVSVLSPDAQKIQKLKVRDFYLENAEKMASIGHFEVELQTGKIFLSDQFKEILEIQKEGELFGWLEMLLMVHKEDRRRVMREFRKCAKISCDLQIDFRMISTSGKVKWIHAMASINFRDGRGDPSRILGLIRDVSDQKSTELNLRELNIELEKRVLKRTYELEKSQKLYKLIAQNFPNGEINVFDKDLNYVFVEGMEMYRMGITGEMLIGTSFLERIDEEIREEVESKLRGVFDGKNIGFELKSKDKTFMIYSVGLKDEDHKISQIMMVSQNITKLKQAEEEIQGLLEKEQKLNELKSRFVSMASHEFRTPLTTITNSVSLLSKYIPKDENEEKSLKHIKRVKKSAVHLNGILNDFLSLDKLVEGKITVSDEELDLKELVNGCLQEINFILKKGQTIDFKYSGPEKVISDHQVLNIVLTNLLSNASKYSNENKPIELKVCTDNDEINIQVTDYGIGIPLDEQNQLFERFFRAKNALNIQGTGLGLSIVSNYLKLLGGEITFNSVPEEQTTFSVKIPLKK